MLDELYFGRVAGIPSLLDEPQSWAPARNSRLSEEERELLRLGLEFYGSLARQHPESDTLRFAKAKAINRYARIEYELDHHVKKAEQAYLRALDQLKKVPSSSIDANHLSMEIGLAHRFLSTLYLFQNQREKSLLHAQMAVDADPDSPEAIYNYGHLADRYAQLGQYEKAVDARNKLLKLAPNRIDSIRNRALLHLKFGNYKMALADIAKAVELKPSYIINNLWWTHPADVAACPDKTFRDGILKLADKTIELTNGSASAYSARARLLQAFGRHEQALADIEKAIELGSDSPLICNSTAWYIVQSPGMKTELIQHAIVLAQKAVELETKDKYKRGMYLSTLGVAQYRAENWTEAIKALQKSDQLLKGENYSSNGFFLSMAHWQLGQQDEARQLYQISVD